MKQTIKSIIRTVKSVKGNSLAEFATTTALMATLAATAAPKLSEMSEGTKGEKSRNEIDKLIKQAGNFYQDKADDEGRGRFPGQSKFNMPVGGHASYDNSDASTLKKNQDAEDDSDLHKLAVMEDLGLGSGDGWRNYDDTHANVWVSCFGTSNADALLPADITSGIDDNLQGIGEWKELVGGETLSSKFQDGHFVYTVIAGYGSGTDVYPPVLYVGDIENMVDFNNVLEP